jgi:hypothetical protein
MQKKNSINSEIAARLMVWRKENLQEMKRLVEGMSMMGENEEALRWYKWLAEDSIRLKHLVKYFQ